MLKDFYSDMRGHAFKLAMWFLAQKFRMHQSLEALDEAVIQDRTVWEDAEIFAAGTQTQPVHPVAGLGPLQGVL